MTPFKGTNQKMKKALIIGAGTHGEVYASFLKEEGVTITGFIDDDEALQGQTINGIKVIGKYGDLFDRPLKNKVSDIYCPIGNNTIRQKYLSELKEEGYGTPSYIHPSVQICPNVKMGEAIYLLPGNIILPHTTIGSFFMMSSGSTVGHHVTIKESVFISSGINIGASLTIHERAYFGIGSTVMTGIKHIGKDAMVGAGSVVFKDVPDNAVIAGNPAKLLNKNKLVTL